MKPYMDARSSSSSSAASCSSSSCSSISHPWSPQPGLQYSFSGKGCRQLRILDINRTNYPKRTIDASGEVIVDLGLTRDSVLCAAIVLQELRVIRWTELGEILQLLEMVYGEAGVDDRQAGSVEASLPKNQEVGHLHVQLLLRRPG